MDWLLDVAFVLGAGLAWLIAPLAVLGVYLRRAPRWFVAGTIGLGIVVWLLFASHLVVWCWFAFDYEHGEPVPNDLFPVTTVLMVSSAVGCVLLLLANAVPWPARPSIRTKAGTRQR